MPQSYVVTSWPSVPVEIVRAAGLCPLIVRGASGPTPAADVHLEPGIFPSRLRRLVDDALTGRLVHAARIVIPRTSDADYKCFLYLREFVRRGVTTALAPVVLFDLLQSSGADVAAYDAARLHALLDELSLAPGGMPSDDDLRGEIVRANAARAAARRLVELRRPVPRVMGAEVFPLLAAFWGGKLIQLDWPRRIAAAISGSQKTLPVSLILFDAYFSDYPLAIAPLVFFHFGQLIADTAVADVLTHQAKHTGNG